MDSQASDQITRPTIMVSSPARLSGRITDNTPCMVAYEGELEPEGRYRGPFIRIIRNIMSI